ncbi:hypothetical protein [Streptomyces yanii]|uniref:Uncharacterized protein n=1 Tax=Streptomyces yanii TaxID=78510 RepID=A0ABV5RF36_9ACTN
MWPPPATEAHSAVLRVQHDTGIRADLCHGMADRPDAGGGGGTVAPEGPSTVPAVRATAP